MLEMDLGLPTEGKWQDKDMMRLGPPSTILGGDNRQDK